MSRLPCLLFLAALAASPTAPVRADDAADFIARFSGEWRGGGEILIGPDNGVQFECSLDGDPSRTGLTFAMTGRCWLGRLSAPVHAQLRYNAETNRFYGDFLGGSAGDGLDVVGKRDGAGFSLDLSRGSIQGRLAAETVNADQMRVIVFYRDRKGNRELPVIAMGFTRSEAGQPGPQDFRPDVATGSLGTR